MNRLTSIVVTVETDGGPQTFPVDLDQNCLLVWGDAGWNVLADYYDQVKHDPAMAKEVRDRACPKAKPKDAATAPEAGGTALIALKTPDCLPTEWP